MLTAGLGLKPQFFQEALECADDGLWFEVHPENYMVDGGPRLAWLETIRARHPVSLHGVALSLAGPARPDPSHLQRLRALALRFEPVLMSEHLAWSAWRGSYLPDLLPVPRTASMLARTAAHIQEAQDALRRPLAIENPSHYVQFDGHAYGEIDFLRELVRRTDCTLLLDLNNVWVSAANLGFDAASYVDDFPAESVREVHLAGHSVDANAASRLLIDSHDAPVAAPVWALYQRFIERAGPRPTLIERDDALPPFAALREERWRAHAMCRRAATAPLAEEGCE